MERLLARRSRSLNEDAFAMWYQLAVTVLGLWIMASPDVMGYEGPERLNNHIVGPLVVSMAIIALAETTRGVRWVNVVLGCWLVAAPVLLQYEPLSIGVRSAVLGIAIAGLSWFPGERRSLLGGGWSALWKRRLEGGAPTGTHPDKHYSPVGRRNAG
jgi:hypothetical protein